MGDAERDAELAVEAANEEWIRQGADAEEAEANASNESLVLSCRHAPCAMGGRRIRECWDSDGFVSHEALRAEVEALRKRAEGKDRIIRGQVESLENLRALCGLDSDLGPWEARCRRAEDERDKIKAWAEATIAEADAVIAKRVEERDEARTAYVAMCYERDAARRTHVEAVAVLREVLGSSRWSDTDHEFIFVRKIVSGGCLARADAVLAGQVAQCEEER